MRKRHMCHALKGLLAALVLITLCGMLMPEKAGAGSVRAAEDTYSRDGAGSKASAATSVTSEYDGILYSNSETGYEVVLEDDANLLTESERAELLEDMKPITAYGNVAFKSVDYNSSSVSSYAAGYYSSQFGSQSGTVFLIDMDNREIYIYAKGEMYRTITKSIADTITDNVYSYASRQDYYKCASTAYSQIAAKMSGARIAQPMKYTSNLFLALILAMFFNYFCVKAFSGTRKPTDQELLDNIYMQCNIAEPQVSFRNMTRTYSPRESDSGGHHHGGGGGSHHSGGGGHHSSGGGGGHRF